MSGRNTAAALALALAIAGCGEKSEPAATPPPPATTPAVTGAGGEAAVSKSFKRYIAAINRKDGAAVCQSIVPAGQEMLRPPVKRESCAAGVKASIGHASAAGLTWRAARITAKPVITVSGKTATLQAKVTSTYSDGMAEPEEELVKLRVVDRKWLLDAPDATLLRAIGQK